MPLIFAVIAAALVVALTANGVNVSPDSSAYLQAAADVSRVGGVPLDYSWWPPLYPLTLALFADAQTATQWLNAACYALSVMLTLYALESRLHQGAGIAILGAALILSPALQYVHQWAWSEPAFIALVTAWFALLLTDVRKHVVLFALATALACLQRYSGVLLIPLGVFALVLYRVHWKRIAVYVVIAGVPLALWMLRNVALGYPASGAERGIAALTWDRGGWFTVNTLLSWWFPLTLAGIVGARYRVRLPLPFTVTAGYYVIAHIGMTIYSGTVTYINNPDNRLLAPVFIPLVYLALVTGGKLRCRALNVRISCSSIPLVTTCNPPNAAHQRRFYFRRRYAPTGCVRLALANHHPIVSSLPGIWRADERRRLRHGDVDGLHARSAGHSSHAQHQR